MESQKNHHLPSNIPPSIRRLASAMILQGIQDYLSDPGKVGSQQNQEWHNTEGWLLGVQADVVFSFKWCCDVLNVSYRTLQKQIENGELDAAAVRKLRLHSQK